MIEIPDALLGPLGLLIGALIVIWSGVKEWWIPGSAYRRLLDERDRCDAKTDRLAELAYTNAAAAKILSDMLLKKSENTP